MNVNEIEFGNEEFRKVLDMWREFCRRQREHGLEYGIVTTPKRRTRGRRVTTFPGALGTVVGSSVDRLMVSVRVDAIERFIKRCDERMHEIESAVASAVEGTKQKRRQTRRAAR